MSGSFEDQQLLRELVSSLSHDSYFHGCVANSPRASRIEDDMPHVLNSFNYEPA